MIKTTRLPALAMGLTNLPYGAYGAVTLIKGRNCLRLVTFRKR